MAKEDKKLKVRIFMEVLGWPEEALTTHLKTILTKLKKHWKILNEHYETPVKLENMEKMFTSHVEFEAEVPNFNDLVAFCLSFGPSVVEILEPSYIHLTAGDMQDMLSDMISKIQIMDKEIKVLAAQKKILDTQLNEIQPKKHSKDDNIKI